MWLIKKDVALSYRSEEIRRIGETKEKLKVRTRKLGALNASTLSIRNIGVSNMGSPSLGGDEEAKSEESGEEEPVKERDDEEFESLDQERQTVNA